MATDLLKNVPEIDSVILIDSDYRIPRLDFTEFNILNRFDSKMLFLGKRYLAKLAKNSQRKFLYLERSRGLSKFTPKSRNYLIPMWEQDAWKDEISSISKIIAITKKTESIFSSLGIETHYLPWGTDQPEISRRPGNIRNILHNAGSLGEDFRKGTPEAIKMFQESRVAEKGVKLHIHTWSDSLNEVQQQIASDPLGIELRTGFIANLDDIYKDKDLLLYPSRVEGHALPVLEAHARGIPAMCTNVSPINEYETDELFLLNGETFGNRTYIDIGEAARKLDYLSTLNLNDKSNKVSELVSEFYTWESLARKYGRLLS